MKIGNFDLKQYFLFMQSINDKLSYFLMVVKNVCK